MDASTNEQDRPAWVLTVTLGAAHTAGLNEWLVKVMLTGIDSPGYINAEILPPAVHENQDTWSLVIRFAKSDQVDHWQTSDRLIELMREINDRVHAGHFKLQQKKVEHYLPATHVASAIVTHIKPGKEADYREWLGEINVAQTNAPGYRGTFLQPSAFGSKAPWTTLLRFDSTESLDHWFDSEERNRLIAKAGDMLRYDIVQMTSTFPGWFPIDPSTGQKPANHKTAMLVLLVLYPLLIIRATTPALFPDWPAALSMFLSVCISVCLISLVMMPIAVKAFKFWLYPTGHNPEADNIKGYFILCALYAVEIALAYGLMMPR